MPKDLSPNAQSRSVESATPMLELSRRPSRPANHAMENRALVALVHTMATAPSRVLQELSDTALALCHAQSAGISLLEEEDRHENFHWRAVSGEWSPHLNGGTPRDFGPCGTVLDRNMPLMFSHPERDFQYFADITPLLEEALFLPFYVDGEAHGTIWVGFHDASRRFDAEDLRVLTNLGTLAGLAYQSALSLGASARFEQESARSDIVLGRFKAIVESSEDAIFSMNLNGIINSWNRGGERLFGYTAAEAIGRNTAMLIPPDRVDEEPEILARVRRGEHIHHYETKRACRDGRTIDISLTVSPVRDAAGRVVGASKIARDISDRKHSQERQTLLVAEMKHRIKNTLSTVQAVAMQTLRSTPPEERDVFIARLLSLSAAHDALTKENWNRASLRALINNALEPFRNKLDDCFLIEGPEIWLDAGKSTLLVMAIHELATNAAKYGALSNDAGRVSILWNVSATEPRAAILLWQEAGGPPVAPPTRRGFGSRLLETALKSEFGEPELKFLSGGVFCKLVIAL